MHIEVENIIRHLISLECVGILARVRKKKRVYRESKDMLRHIPSLSHFPLGAPDNTPVIYTPICTTHFI